MNPTRSSSFPVVRRLKQNGGQHGRNGLSHQLKHGGRSPSSEGASVDVVGGIRYWHVTSELQFQAGVLPGMNLEASRGWVDGIVGLRARGALSRKWWVSAYGDLGAGGSKFTYQIVGNTGLDIHERYALDFGYRFLDVDYDNDDLLIDTAMQGPLLGFTIKF